MFDGRAFELPTSVPPITGSDSSSSRHLPTPLASDGEKERNNPSQARRKSPPLSAVNHLLPTPVAQPSGNTPENHLRKKPGRETVTDLAILVENDLLKSGGKVLPTPRAADHQATMGSPGAARHVEAGNGSLAEVIGVNLMPTPTASDATGGGQHPSKRTGHTRQLIDTVLGLTGEPTPPLFDDGSD